MKAYILLFLLGTTLMLAHDAEANWLTNIVSKVVGFVKKNCHFNLVGGINFGCGFKFGRKRRSVGMDGDTPFSALGASNMIDPATGFDCTPVVFPEDKVPRRAVDEAFELIDDNQDDELDDKEIAQYQATMQIFDNCVKKQIQAKK